MKNCVYRFINKNAEVIYVGKAKDLKQRLNGHTHLPKECYKETTHIEYLQFETEDDIDFAERYYISKLKPKFNIIHSCKDIRININELNEKEWKVYSKGVEYDLQRLRILKENGRMDFLFSWNWEDIADYLLLNDISSKGFHSNSFYRAKFVNMFDEIYYDMQNKIQKHILTILNKQFPYLGFDKFNNEEDEIYFNLIEKKISNEDDKDEEKLIELEFFIKHPHHDKTIHFCGGLYINDIPVENIQ